MRNRVIVRYRTSGSHCAKGCAAWPLVSVSKHSPWHERGMARWVTEVAEWWQVFGGPWSTREGLRLEPRRGNEHGEDQWTQGASKRDDTFTEILPSLHSPIQIPTSACNVPKSSTPTIMVSLFCPQIMDLFIKSVITFCPELEGSHVPHLP